MSLANVAGLDHIVIVVRDLAAAAENWRRLGFKVSDRGLHSAHMGTANHTIMLDEDYIELIGVVAETERNVPTRAFLDRRGEGIERAAFTARSAAGLAKELAANGFPPIGPVAFSRPVERADGVKSDARFETTQWPVDQRPGGLRIFACQHFTRENVWLPELLGHANTARRIERLELLSTAPRAAADHMSRMIDMPIEAEPDGAFRVASG
ncbi:MAG TPA: VOC family protein, partial [Hyphomicrobiaceae bacterium]|nr:VOC family protein [Hyphomicrobiaceae bacterium]